MAAAFTLLQGLSGFAGFAAMTRIRWREPGIGDEIRAAPALS